MAPATPSLLRRNRALRPPEDRLLSRALAICRALAAGASLAGALLEPDSADMVQKATEN